MKLTDEEIINMDIEDLYNSILILSEEVEIDTKEIIKIENGINIKFPTLYAIERWYTEYPDSGNIKIRGLPKMGLLEFHEEKKARETLMRRILMRHCKTDHPRSIRRKQ